MCGIAGLLNSNGAPADRETLEFMNRVQAHRGPDGQGLFLEGPVGLAHVRLAILDLTEAGHQPLTLDGYTMTYNGEVYNYRELRKDLEKKGHTFRTGTDTEVVLASYAEWGTDCLEKFNGMWAFCIYDRKRYRPTIKTRGTDCPGINRSPKKRGGL